MKKILTTLFILALLTTSTNIATAKSAQSDIKLPDPIKSGGMPIMDAFANRHTSIKFAKEEIPQQILSNLLWAADGINRPDGKRTAPSALNTQNITIYVATDDTIYKFDPQTNTLISLAKDNLSLITGVKAPITLIYVAKLGLQSKHLATVDCGFIAQNVYLFSAANNLNTMFMYGVNSSALNYKLNLSLGEEVLFAQPVGYPPIK